MFPYANVLKKLPREIDFIYLGNKEIYFIFKTCCLISIVFSINHMLKFKEQPGCLKAKMASKNSLSHINIC